MTESLGPSIPAGGRHQRRLRNYLLDPPFQLKYSGYLVGIAVLLSLGLGTFLWRTGEAVISQSREAVQQGENVVARGREVLAESQKVSAVVQMNIVRDPDYSQNPALLEAFKADAEKQDARLADQQRALEQQAASLKHQASELSARQRMMFFTLCGALTLLVILIGLAGIVVTHRIAGPVHKMKRQIREVGRGHLQIPSKLRRGDELTHFFDAFEHMVIDLRERQGREISELEKAIATLDGVVEPAALEPLNRLRDQMKAALD
ncbi:MAG TPA: HAMP domain-containing protein [Polyangiaceae bacterium]|jgi:methyl-accepting chemotaxis protein|nr:HAMP domain-containing protein [Polyangiaceae bacterium]